MLQLNPNLSDRRTKTVEMDLEVVNHKLAEAKATEIVEWTAANFTDGLIMTTSFGIQSAVMLHLVTRIIPDIPVIWLDTGYLPAETYIFAEQLRLRLKLNLKVYQSSMSPARMEALHGKLWQKNDIESLNQYDRIRKVEPMQRALKELNAKVWFAGLRKNQTNHRKNLQVVDKQGDQYKILPILNWGSKEVYKYLRLHDLPYHPLFDKGYVTVGDWHSSRPITPEDEDERDTRFKGLKQECGLHLPLTPGEARSLDSSTL